MFAQVRKQASSNFMVLLRSSYREQVLFPDCVGCDSNERHSGDGYQTEY